MRPLSKIPESHRGGAHDSLFVFTRKSTHPSNSGTQWILALHCAEDHAGIPLDAVVTHDGIILGGLLVVIITRVAHPSPRIVCGHMRRWAPIIASDEAGAVAVAEADPPEPRG